MWSLIQYDESPYKMEIWTQTHIEGRRCDGTQGESGHLQFNQILEQNSPSFSLRKKTSLLTI